MIIKEILHQHRRDFRAVFLCENCGHEYEADGYDDTNFHRNVVPEMVCTKCGEVAGENYRALTTKYPDGKSV